MAAAIRHETLTATGIGIVAALIAYSPADAEVSIPACDAVETWALTIDPDDRWHPNPAQKKFWLPSRFQGAEFEALFGEPAMEWARDDVKSVRSLLTKCAKEARKAKRIDAQKAIYTARAFVSGNLKNYIVQTARAGAKLDKNLDALVDLPDSPALLQVLALLRNLEAGDKNALRDSQRQIARIRGAEAKAARQIVISAYRQTPESFAADTLPRLDERYEALRSTYVEQGEDQLAQHAAGPAGLAEIDATLTGLKDTFGSGLDAKGYMALEQVAEQERATLRKDILEEATARIDALADDPKSIGAAAAIVKDAEPSLDDASVDTLHDHAAARQQAIAGNILADANKALAAFPETLAGIDALDRHVAATTGIVGDHLAADRVTTFLAAADARRSAIAAAALPEFTDRIAGLHDDAAGLEALKAEATRVASWQGLSADIRAGYDAALESRRTAIEVAVAEAARQRKAERQRNVVASTNARIDALPADFGSLAKIDAAVKLASREGLDDAAMAEIESHAAKRRNALANEMLALATPKLREGPQTIEGLGKLGHIVDAVIAETQAHASPAALDAFRQSAIDAGNELGHKLLDGFDDELEALPEDRGGLEKTQQLIAWAKSLRYVDDDLREDFADAASERRDDISDALAAAEAERRERVLAAGGDPEVVGYSFADENGLSSIEFVDEKRAIFSALGLRFGATYEIVKDDIFLEGPNGTIVFAHDGNKLSGMGLNLKRVER